ncbi:MbtH family NRPS accessory protein [Streptomyces sp. NPDC054841]
MTATNSLDVNDGDWLVVVNDHGQYALWRPFLDLPGGWRAVVLGPDRDTALRWVETHWTQGPEPAELAATDS